MGAQARPTTAAATTGTTVRERKSEEKKNAEEAAYNAVHNPEGKIGNAKNRDYPNKEDLINAIDVIINGLKSTDNRAEDLLEIGRKVVDQQRSILESTTRHNSPKSSPSRLRNKRKLEVREDMENIMVLRKMRKQMQDNNEPEEEIQKINDRIEAYEYDIVNLEEKIFQKENEGEAC